MRATTCSTLLGSPVKAAERVRKMKPELYPGFSNPEVIVGFAKSDGAEGGSVWIEELVEVKKWSKEERQTALSSTGKSKDRLFGGGICGIDAFLFVFMGF